MATIPLWVTGRQITNLQIIPQNISSVGLLSPATAVPLTGVLENIMLRNQPEEAEISPLDATATNDVILKDSQTLELTELLQNAPAPGTGANALAHFSQNWNYGQFTVTRGGNTWSFYGQRSTFSDGGDKGVWKSTLTLKMVGIPATYT